VKKKRLDSRSAPVLFELGDFEISTAVADLLSEAEVRRLVLRHGRGDWGSVSEHRRKMNDAFASPKNHAVGSYAQSLHETKNLQVAVLTKQERGRRTTRLFLI